MSDTALTWLARQINEEQAPLALWCSDENVLHQLSEAGIGPIKPLLITNRLDVAQQAENQGFDSQFSDFDFSGIQDNSLSHIFYRISKEKPVVHHIINSAHRMLIPGGRLYLCGQKNEGIKTYIEKAGILFGCEKSQQKNGTAYTAILKKITTATTTPLDDSNYAELRPVATLNSLTAYSKPGLFGWNKIDQGSEFLIQHLPELLACLPKPPRHLLDLGCGYGYLTLMTAGLALQERVLTDNNAAALITARYNCEQNHLAARIIAADGGDSIHQTFDLILCNPPFHQGFSLDGDLTDKFVVASRRLLAKGGLALFVVNQFIPLERKARDYFNKVNMVANNGSFKLISLAQ